MRNELHSSDHGTRRRRDPEGRKIPRTRIEKRLCAQVHSPGHSAGPITARCNRPNRNQIPTLASRHPRATKTLSALLGSDGKERSGQLLNFVAFAFGACWRELFVFGNAANQGEPFVAILA